MSGGGFFSNLFGSNAPSATAPPTAEPGKAKPEVKQIAYKLETGHVSVHLQPGQKVLARNGAMLWYDEGLKVRIRSGKIGAAIMRVFSGNELFMTEYANESEKPLSVSLGSSLPMSQIQAIEIAPGSSYIADNACLVGTTSNVVTGGKISLRGFIMDNGLFLSHFSVPKDSPLPGIVFIAGFGGVQEYVVPEGERKMVDTGMFLAAPEESTRRWEMKLVGSIGGSLFNGEGIAIAIPGPAKMYLHTHNLRDFAQVVAAYIPPKR